MKKAIYFSIVILFVSINIQAQENNPLPPDRYETNITEPINLRKGYLRSSYTFIYMTYSDFFNDNSKHSHLYRTLDNFYSSGVSSFDMVNMLTIEYGITNNFQIEIALPYKNGELTILSKTEDVVKNNLFNSTTKYHTNGFGDISAYLKYQFINKPDFYSALSFGVYCPSGTKKNTTIQSQEISKTSLPASNEEYIINPGLWFKKVYYPYSFELKPAYTYKFGNDQLEKTSGFECYSQFGVLLNEWFSINNIWDYMYSSKRYNKELKFSSPKGFWLNTGVCILQQVKRFRFKEEVLIPVTGKNSSSNMNLMFSVYYTL